jgi:V/A-type H+/Na+-transporting ATPase subunit C
MISGSIHAAPVAKAHVMMGYLIDNEGFGAITKCDSVEDVIRSLATLPQYQSYLKPEGLMKQPVEMAIKQAFFNIYEKLYHYYIGEYRDFFKALLLRYEVENIKYLIRRVTNLSHFDKSPKSLLIPSVYKTLSYENLMKARQLSTLIEALSGTPYGDLLKPFVDEEPAKMLFHMEMVLDRYYFNVLRDRMNQLKKMDRQLMLRLLGVNIDLLNIQWIYRGIHFFNVSPEEIYNFTLSGGFKFDYKALKSLCYYSQEAFRQALDKSEYSTVFKAREYLMEREMERYLFYEIDKILKVNAQTIATPVALLFKFEYEIRDILTILEAIRFKSTEIDSYLIRDLRRE